MKCKHIYETLGQDLCDSCGEPTREINWQYQNELNRQWKLDNPSSGYGGWWSI